MIEDFADEFWIGDVCDDPKLPAAERAQSDIDFEDALQALRPGAPSSPMRRTIVPTPASARQQRFGSALNLNIHFHMLFLDGGYSFDRARPKSHGAPLPTSTELAKLLHRISLRVARLLEQQTLLVRDLDHDFLDFEPGEVLHQLIGASIHYRIAIGPNPGRKALTLCTVPA